MTPAPPAQARRVVDLGAVRHNVAVLRRASPAAELMAVVKADGYGHGAVAVARTALDAGATSVGVAVLEEAFELRDAGVGAPLLAWLAAPGARYAEAVARDVDLAAHSADQLVEIGRAARAAGRPALVHLKADTGMWRGGAPPEEWPAVLGTAVDLERQGAVTVVGVWSHLACADEPGDPSVGSQLAAFDRAVAAARASGLRPTHVHIANSAATLTRPDSHHDLVRCGLALYGVSPVPDPGRHEPLRPALSLRARVTSVKRAPAGSAVSYGHTYRTERDTTLAVLPVGYADGVPRALSGTAEVGRDGQAFPVAGRVSMDQLVIDVGDARLQRGDEVTVVGTGQDGEQTVAQWAERAGTIPYEILTGLGRRRTALDYV